MRLPAFRFLSFFPLVSSSSLAFVLVVAGLTRQSIRRRLIEAFRFRLASCTSA
jgi:hypothetical protein